MTEQSESTPIPTVVRLMRLEDVKASVGLSQATIYRLIAGGQFPRPCKMGTGSRWVSSEIEAWIAERIVERDSHGKRAA